MRFFRFGKKDEKEELEEIKKLGFPVPKFMSKFSKKAEKKTSGKKAAVPTEPQVPKGPEFPPLDFALLGLRYDKTQTLRKGAARAPAIIRQSFPKLETFVYGIDLSACSLKDLGDVSTKSPKELHKKTAVRLASTNRFPIILGGEHSVSLAAVRALKPDNFVVMDAHPDCEASEGHDGVTRKVAEIIGPENVYIFGARVASAAEDSYIRKSGINIVDNVKSLQKIKGKTYLSVDFDVLDPSILPAVGNPEPMGLSFAEACSAIQTVVPRAVAADFVEFTPVEGGMNDIHALIAGKLIYSTMAAVVKGKQK